MQFFQNTFQSLLKSSRSAIYRNGYVLEAKIGRCSFEFPEFIKTQFVNIYLKKISGNGKVIINQIEYIVSSKQEEVISIPFINRISIERSKDSIGEISVLGFSIDENKEKANVSENWKSLITRCGEFKGLKLFNALPTFCGFKLLEALTTF